MFAKPGQVTCTVSAPNEEGRDFAEDLREAGLNVDLVPDESAPGVLGECSILVVGADTVFRDGTLCNKIGTHTLAQAAETAGVHLVVACEVLKLAPSTAPRPPSSTSRRQSSST